MQTLEDILGSRTNIGILRYLSAIRGGLSGNEIATRLGMQQSSARQSLERLVAAGIVTRHDIGKSAAYELDYDLVFTQTVLLPLFHAESQLRDTLIGHLVHNASSLFPLPRAVILFGSLARGARDFHDIDLLCIVSQSKDKALLHDAIATDFEEIRRQYRVPVSPVVVTERELRSSGLQSVVRSVKQEGILLFGTAPLPLRQVRRWMSEAQHA